MAQEAAFAQRAQVHAADFQRQSIGLGADDDVGAKGAQLARQLVADVHRHAQGSGGDADAQRQRRQGQQLPPPLAKEGTAKDAEEHGSLYWFRKKTFPLTSSLRGITSWPPSTRDSIGTGLQPPGRPMEGV